MAEKTNKKLIYSIISKYLNLLKGNNINYKKVTEYSIPVFPEYYGHDSLRYR